MRRFLAGLCLAFVAAAVLAQHSPAPEGPAEGPQKANPGSGTAPGVHPPSPMSGGRFAPGPPPPPPGATEPVPAGRVTTTESISVPTPVPTFVPTVSAAPVPTRAPTPIRKKGKAKVRRTPVPTTTRSGGQASGVRRQALGVRG
ncbi:MAG: hypothetical protein ABI682_15500 [Acidobacteriota bacterium]